jgi:lactoylglutathione lyase
MKIKYTYTGIRVKDLEESVRFYTDLLEMKEIGRSKIQVAKGEVVSLASEDGGFILELNHYDKSSKYNSRYTVGEGLDHLAFQSEDLDALLAKAKKMGHSPIVEMKTEQSRWAYIEDPNGIWIELFQG